MRILWITNITFPEVYKLLGETSNINAGGWMLSSANSVVTSGDVQLAVASVTKLVKKLTAIKGEKISYYLLPYGKGNEVYNDEYEKMWIEVKKQFNPDVVHIHGTEFTHGLAYVNACGSDNVVVSIQGLLHVIKRYSTCGISNFDILKNTTLSDILTGSGLLAEKLAFARRGKYEIELLQKVNHVIGRTSWDNAHVWAINPNAQYYHCNESLRPIFYSGVWNYEKCQKHSIFLSQGSSALKGAHMVFKAVSLIIERYPDCKIRIAGSNPAIGKKILGLSLKTGYGKYMFNLIRKHGLSSNIEYLGALDEEEMKREYLKANLFICPSSIENSPNSLCEAQILGVPSLGAFVGGVPDFITSFEHAKLYRYDDVEMLAYFIVDTFENIKQPNMNVVEDSRERHNRSANNEKLISIYKSLNTMKA